MYLLEGVVTIREHTCPLSTSPTCEERQAQLLLCPANCGCKNSLPRLAEKSRVVKDYGSKSGNAELISNTRITEGEILKVKSSQSSERRRQYGLKTTSASSNVLCQSKMRLKVMYKILSST